MFYAVFQVIPYFRIVELAVGDNTSTIAVSAIISSDGRFCSAPCLKVSLNKGLLLR